MGLFSDGPRPDSPATRERIEAARRRLKENPADTGAVLTLADALATSGQKAEAVMLLNRYGPIVQARGRLEDAIAVYKKASQLDPHCDLTSSTYLSHLQLKKILDAEKEAPTETPAAPAPPPSGTFTRPGPDPPPPSGSFPKPAAAPTPPSSGFFPHATLPESPPPSGVFAAPEPAAPPSEWSQKREAVHGARPGIALLRDIPPVLIDLVLQRINLITLAPGEILFREGSEGNSLYFVVQGALEISTRSDLGVEVLLRTARNGEAIGETSFLTALPRYATATAREPSHLLELDHNAVTPIARKHRPLAEALSRLYEERVLGAALARSRVFGVLSDDERRQLTQKLRPAAVQAGTLVVREGVPAKGAYIVKRGAFRVTFRSGDRSIAVSLLRPHEVFGDLAGERELQAESVTAVVESELLCLATEDLSTFRSASPRLAAALEALRLERAERSVAALLQARR